MRFGRLSGGEVSILAHIAANLTEDGLAEDGDALPDDEAVAAATGLRWAPGALEGTMGRHAGRDGEDDDAIAEELHAAFVALADRPGRRARSALRTAVEHAEPRAHVDGMIGRLRADPPRDAARLHQEARALVVTSGRRDEVKLGIAVLGLFGSPEDGEVLRTLARHDEFTVYAAIALAGAAEDHVAEWAALARLVHGWGRIELVELLLREPRPEVCAWLLREGFRNDVMYGYTAHMVAEGCGLAGALDDPEPDRALIEGARDMLATLADDAWGGPAGGMLDYDDGLAAARRLLEILDPRDLADFLAVQGIRDFAEDGLLWAEDEREALEARREALGWTREVRAEVADDCRAILEQPLWDDLVPLELARDQERISWEALQVARRLGVPTRDVLAGHLRRHPGDANAWSHLVQDADAETMDIALMIARKRLRLGDLAEGPALDPPRGDGVFGAAEFLLQALRRHPGRGWELLRPALLSPVVRQRAVAVAALADWPPELLGPEQLAALAEVRDGDPDDGVRAAAGDLLARGLPAG